MAFCCCRTKHFPAWKFLPNGLRPCKIMYGELTATQANLHTMLFMGKQGWCNLETVLLEAPALKHKEPEPKL